MMEWRLTRWPQGSSLHFVSSDGPAVSGKRSRKEIRGGIAADLGECSLVEGFWSVGS